MRHQSGALGLSLLLVLWSGCSVITNFDRFGPGDGGTRMDGEILIDGCTPMGAEVCNGVDDDCDGDIDENTLDDPDNCGACDFVCQAIDDAAPDCTAGECTANCNTGFEDCDGLYATGCEVDLRDPDHCAACGTVCAPAEVCTASGCSTECPGSEEACERSCVDTNTSTTHCGGCGMPCADRPNAVAVCAARTCDFVCEAGFDDCDGMVDNGCETDLTTVTNCDTCGTVCSYANGIPACTAGACERAGCNVGFDDCDMDDANGCETDLSTTTDCGMCDNACADPMSATGTCSPAGMCAFDCDVGFLDCNRSASDGCEADLNSAGTCGSCTRACSAPTPLCNMGTCVSGCMAPTPTSCGTSCVNTDTDILHCGGCSMPCPTLPHSTPTCARVGGIGTCAFACDVDWADCNPMPGCETSIRTVTDCDGCGVACSITNGTGTCATGTCAISSCTTGFRDCIGGAVDGCETDIRTPANCGSCGAVCTLPNAVAGCSGTMCTVASCTGGFTDCDANPMNGCEETRRTYYRDGDADGYGAGAGMAFCLSAVPAGWVMVSGDCQDGNVAIHPGATEVCNGVDDNCVSGIDEGFMVGATCRCETGADPGTIMCDVGGTASCRYPVESCNGLDDDCASGRDDTFMCVRGTTRSCTGAMGTCTYVGTQICSTSCAWGACPVPPESCNRMDDDCDLFTDEAVLTMGTAVTTVAGVTAWEPRAAWHPTRNEMAIVYGDGMPSSTGGNVYVVRATLTGTVIGTPRLLDSNARSWDVAFDGTHYSVAYTSGGMVTGSPYLARIDAATGALGGTLDVDTVSSGDGARRIAIARVGTANQVVFVWVEPGSFSQSVEARLVDTPPAVTSAAPVGGVVRLESSGGSRLMDWPIATVTAAGAMIGYAHWRNDGGGDQNIALHQVTPGFIDNARSTIANDLATAERQLSITSNRAGVIGVAYTKFDPASGTSVDTVITAVRTSPFLEFAERSVGLSNDVSIAYGADDTFAVLHVPAGGGGRISRFRSTDLSALPETSLVPAWTYFLTEVGGTHATRYVTLRHGGALQAQPAVCP